MSKSPFKNFDPEALSTQLAFEQPIAGSHAVTDLLRRAAIVCCPLRISNTVILELIDHVATHGAPAFQERVSFDDFYPDHLPQLETEGITIAQLNAARALLLIDETLDIVATDNWTADIVDRLLLASAWISDANEKVVDDSKWKALANTIDELECKRDADILETVKSFIRRQSDVGREHAEKNERNRAQNALKEHAAHLFDEGRRKGRWNSVQKAVKDIIPQVQEFAKENNLSKHMFAPTNVERTIYNYLLAHDKKKR